jgi:hypothetical protein
VSPRFQLQLDQERYAPGETIEGTIVVVEGGGSRSLAAVLEYIEETEDYTDVATSISTGQLHAGELTTGVSIDFELALPLHAFPNYRSEHGELYWQVDLKSDELGRDTHERHRIDVVMPPDSEASP